MLNFIKNLLSTEANPELENFLAKGAVIIDVRTPLEYKTGHVAGSINIPLQTIGNQVQRIKKMNKPVITCCASGNRSGIALQELEAAGIKSINGGSWRTVKKASKELEEGL